MRINRYCAKFALSWHCRAFINPHPPVAPFYNYYRRTSTSDWRLAHRGWTSAFPGLSCFDTSGSYQLWLPGVPGSGIGREALVRESGHFYAAYGPTTVPCRGTDYSGSPDRPGQATADPFSLRIAGAVSFVLVSAPRRKLV